MFRSFTPVSAYSAWRDFAFVDLSNEQSKASYEICSWLNPWMKNPWTQMTTKFSKYLEGK